jgi:hypothetical protein
MSTYSKNLFDILGDGEVPRPQPVKEEAAAPVVVDKKNVSKINKDGKCSFSFYIFSLSLESAIRTPSKTKTTQQKATIPPMNIKKRQHVTWTFQNLVQNLNCFENFIFFRVQ